jgi:hypothetical protein
MADVIEQANGCLVVFGPRGHQNLAVGDPKEAVLRNST